MSKLYDLAVVTRKYTDNNGNEKSVWKNIGSIIETKNGGKIILIDRTFNPAGVYCDADRDQIMISMFEPKPREMSPAQQAHSEAKANGYQPGSTTDGGFKDMGDEIPF